MQNKIEEFLASYIETALWSSTDEDGTPLDSARYSDVELAGETRQKMLADCSKFLEQSQPILDLLEKEHPIAHDFWLTRNRHGAGFWDGDYPKEIGKALTDLAHSFGECDLYIGDDGKLYL